MLKTENQRSTPAAPQFGTSRQPPKAETKGWPNPGGKPLDQFTTQQRIENCRKNSVQTHGFCAACRWVCVHSGWVNWTYLSLLGNHALWPNHGAALRRVQTKTSSRTEPEAGTYVALWEGWYSNKAESNSIHWTAESVVAAIRRRSFVAAQAATEAARGAVKLNNAPLRRKLICSTLFQLPSS